LTSHRKGGEGDLIAEMNEGSRTEIDVPEIDHTVCKINPSVPRFEGEEDIRVETKDLPIDPNSPAPIESPTAEIVDPPDFTSKTLYECIEELSPSVVETLEGCASFFEGAEVHQDKLVLSFFVASRFESFRATRAYEEGQEIDMDERGLGLTIADVGQLVRPPEGVFEGRWLLSRIVMFVLIAFVEACHVKIASRRNCSRIDLRGSVGITEANTPRDVFSRRRRYPFVCSSPLTS
jgi:hypothetical protein